MNIKEPLFKQAFGSTWETLPTVFQKRYMNRPFSNDTNSVAGKMDIKFSNIMRLFLPIFRLFNVLVPYQGHNIPVNVDFKSNVNTDRISLIRTFYFPNKKPYLFNSNMQVISQNDVIEHMAFGLGWRTNYFYNGTKVVMQHKAYVMNILGYFIPLPLEIFVGKGHAEEEMIDENTYRVTMVMTHPLFGLLYTYTGDFSFKRDD